MAKITIKELETMTAKDAGRILREHGNLAGRITVRKDGVSVSFFYRCELAKAWLLDGVARKDGNAELQRRFNKDLYPALGKTSISSVDAA
ncbi:MAG: integrase [Pseudomonas sp.]|nr:integrase [Pseudomonas sp.]